MSQGLSWKDSFLKVLPQRKGAVVKEENGTENNTDGTSSENSCIDTNIDCNKDTLDKELTAHSKDSENNVTEISVHSGDNKNIVKEELSET